MDQVERLARAIDVLVEYYPYAFGVLLGEAEPPTDDEWIEILTRERLYRCGAQEDLGVSISKDHDHDGVLSQVIALDEVRGVIEEVGWAAIIESTKAIKAFFAEDWEIFCTHVRFVTGESRMGDDRSPLQKVADALRVSANTVTRKRQKVPLMIARDALKGFQFALKW